MLCANFMHNKQIVSEKKKSGALLSEQPSYYISNKSLLEECDKEENLEVNGLLMIPI